MVKSRTTSKKKKIVGELSTEDMRRGPKTSELKTKGQKKNGQGAGKEEQVLRQRRQPDTVSACSLGGTWRRGDKGGSHGPQRGWGAGGPGPCQGEGGEAGGGHRGRGEQEPGTQATLTSQPGMSPGMCHGAQA